MKFFKTSLSVCILLCLCSIPHAFAFHYLPAALFGRHHNRVGKATTADIREMNYDIKRLNFHLNVTDTSTFIVGDVVTGAVVVADSMNNYIVELDSTVIIDSAKFNGLPFVAVHSGNVVYFNLTSALPLGRYFTAEVFYHCVPAASGGFFNAVTHAVSSVGTNMVYSLSDPYAAKNWWPAKQCLDDKIDTVDMYVKVPQGLTDGSNGLLIGLDSTTYPGFWQYHWQTHYPIDYYLISIAVSKYAAFRSYVHFPGTTDSMLVENFIMDTATFDPLYLANFDSIAQILTFYDSLFGRYPFWKEKYGVCYTNLGGGMEHQTMTTIGVPNTYIIAHEMCHQWFGDHVTYAQWGDVWLSEGFATFSEQLFYDHFWGAAAALAHRKYYWGYAVSMPCSCVEVSDTSGPSTIFNYAQVYAKGQFVVSMLRYIAPTDSLFFKVLQTYQQHYGFGNASTPNLKAIADSIYGMNLDTFFNQWVYGKGYPQYKIRWNQIGSSVVVKLIQNATCTASTPVFHTPLELELHSASGADTIMKIYNAADTQEYVFTWDQVMDTVLLNPNIYVLSKTMNIVKDTTLTLKTGKTGMNLGNMRVFPNPASEHWTVSQLPVNAAVALTDLQGKVLWTTTATGANLDVPCRALAPGDYMLILGEGKDAVTIKVSKL